MNLSWLEILAAAYLLWGGIRGNKRGLAFELDNLIGAALALAFLLGFNFHFEFRQALIVIVGLGQQSLGLLGSIAVYIAGRALVRIFRNRFKTWIKRHWSARKNKIWGAISGTLRSAVIIALIMVFTNNDPVSYVRSVIGMSPNYDN